MPATSHPISQPKPNPPSPSSFASSHDHAQSSSPPTPRRMVVGYVSMGSRLRVDHGRFVCLLCVGWWSVMCRLVVDWWSVMCRFLQATFGLNPCQSSPPSQNPPRNSITTTQNPPKPTTIPPSISSFREITRAQNGLLIRPCNHPARPLCPSPRPLRLPSTAPAVHAPPPPR